MNELPILHGLVTTRCQTDEQAWVRSMRQGSAVEIYNSDAPVPETSAGACGSDCKACGVAENKIKPRIKRQGRFCTCEFRVIGHGHTPEAAYRQWQIQMRAIRA